MLTLHTSPMRPRAPHTSPMRPRVRPHTSPRVLMSYASSSSEGSLFEPQRRLARSAGVLF
ncbi:hypothetical protein T484DRAFT_1934673 [Baffinella frigidus]|nr:hypothetical protein T484DRAFT_1934673 [Cryptophyta sp. CCMP2293]